MRLMDIMLALPSLLLAVAVVAVLGPGLTNAMFAVAIVMLPHFVRLTRAAVLGEMAKDYVAGVEHAARGTAPPDVRRGAAELHGAPDRAGDARLLVGDPRRRRARLPRPRRAAADAGMGLDAGERARIHAERLVGRDVAGPSDPDHRARLQPDRRRPARRARSEAEGHEPTPLLEIEHLTVEFAAGGRPLRAVDGVSFSVEQARCSASSANPAPARA